MHDAEVTEEQLLNEFLDALRRLPDVQAALSEIPRPYGAHRGYDAQADIWAGGQPATLLIEVKKTLYPRDVRQVLWQLRNFARQRSQSGEGQHTVPFLIARSISPGAKDLLRDEQVGYYDSGGSLFLPAGNVYVYVDKPPPKSLSKTIRSVFSGRRAQVLHAVLMRHGDWFRVKEIAEQAQVSPATSSQALTELERLDWVVSRGKGPGKERQLREPGALLDAWAKQLTAMRPPAMRRYFVPSVRAEGLVEKLAETCATHKAEYAITHEAAGQRYAPFLSSYSQVRCRLLAGPAADEVIGALEARLVDQGANLAIIDVNSTGELLFRQRMNGTWLASPVQVYLDLIRSQGRAKELAQHLRQTRIGF